MPATAEAVVQTQRYRAGQLAIRAATLRNINQLWQIVDPTELSKTIGPFSEAASILVAASRADSAGLSAAYFTGLKSDLGLGAAEPRLAKPLPDELIRDELRGSSLAGIINARRAGQSVQAAASNGLVKVSGAATKLTLSGGRDTILQSVDADDQAEGWQRVTSGSPCDFCAMLAGRGAVYGSQQTTDFQSHDHCACTAEPVFAELRRPTVNRPAPPPAPTPPQEVAPDVPAEIVPAAEDVAQSVASRVSFPQETLDAMVPKGGWTTSTRPKTVAALKQTAQGRQLLKTLDSFQSGGSTAIPRLRTDIEKYLAGEATDLPQGRIDAIENLLAAIGRSDAGDRALYRGMNIPGEIDDVVAQYRTGETLDLSLASFSSDKKLAQEFTLKGAGKKVRAKVRTPVLIEWAGGGKRALPIQRLSKTILFADEKEWLGSGRYVIENVKRTKRKGTETVVVTIRQTEVW